jgi:hypothetical protein
MTMAGMAVPGSLMVVVAMVVRLRHGGPGTGATAKKASDNKAAKGHTRNLCYIIT